LFRLLAPSARVCGAVVVLLTGAAVAAVFWKMPSRNVSYELCAPSIVNQDLAAVPMPGEIQGEKIEGMSLPSLDKHPVADEGVTKYAQVYEPPAALKQNQSDNPATTAEEPAEPAATKFEPMQRIDARKPIAVETLRNEFQAKPSTETEYAARNDEVVNLFRFAENNDPLIETPPAAPADPFSAASAVPPAEMMQSEGLSPLLPLEHDELKPLLPF
jgi:hypothetical protein